MKLMGHSHDGNYRPKVKTFINRGRLIKEESARITGYVGSIEKQTLKNNYFRQVLFTAKNA